MAFENSSASGPVDLLQKLNTFLVANGWSSDSSVADGVGWRTHVHKGSQYVHMRAQVNEKSQFKDNDNALGYSIVLYLGTAYAGGNAWNDQQTGAPLESATPTTPVGVGMRLQSGAIPNYFFFTDTTNAHVVVVVEHLSGIFSHLGWGSSLAKIGTWTGGDYFFATWDGYHVHNTNGFAGDGFSHTASCPFVGCDPFGNTAAFIRADVDAFTGSWLSLSDNTQDNLGYCGKIASSPILGNSADGNSAATAHTHFPTYAQSNNPAPPGSFQYHQTSAQDGRANLLPVLIYAQRDGSGPGYSPLGTVPTIFCTSAVGQGFSPASDYLIGADTYTMFPNFAVKKVV
jgi:hypothetical protein